MRFIFLFTANDRVDLGLERLMWAFGRLPLALSILFCMEFFSLLLFYPTFHAWATFRTCFGPSKMIFLYRYDH